MIAGLKSDLRRTFSGDLQAADRIKVSLTEREIRGGVDLELAEIISRLDERIAFPSQRRFDYRDPWANARIKEHLKAMVAHQDGYIDPKDGRFVLNALVHLARGYCCNNLCRHCPYVGGARRPQDFEPEL